MYVDWVSRIVEVLGCTIRAEEVGDVILVSKPDGTVKRGVTRAAPITEQCSKVVCGMEAIDPPVDKGRPVIPGAIRLLAGHEKIHRATGNLRGLMIARLQARKECTGMDAGVVHLHEVAGRIDQTQEFRLVHLTLHP